MPEIKMILAVDGEQVDEYLLPKEEYYEVRSPSGALIAEMSK